MKNVDREAEALLYWRVVSDARRVVRDDPCADVSEQQDDLGVIALHTGWPLMKECVKMALLALMPPVAIDLSAFDAGPSPPTMGNGAA